MRPRAAVAAALTAASSVFIAQFNTVGSAAKRPLAATAAQSCARSAFSPCTRARRASSLPSSCARASRAVAAKAGFWAYAASCGMSSSPARRRNCPTRKLAKDGSCASEIACLSSAFIAALFSGWADASFTRAANSVSGCWARAVTAARTRVRRMDRIFFILLRV